MTHPSLLPAGRWKHSLENQHLAQSYPVGQVDGQDVDRCPTDGRATSKHGSTPLKMVSPVVLPRMKQPNNFSRLRIHSGNVWPFVVVTEGANIIPLKLGRVDPAEPIL
jgi:hypothetical protein